MPEWLLAGVGVLIGLILIGVSLWWAFAAESRPKHWFPSAKDQPDNSPGTWPGDSGSGGHGGDFGSHGH